MKTTLAITLSIGALVAMSGCAGQSEPAPEVPMSTSSPEPAVDFFWPNQTVADLQLPAELSSEEMGKLIVETRLTEWENAGFTKELVDEFFGPDHTGSTGEFVEAAIAEQQDIFTEALLVPAWESADDLVKFVAAQKNINGSTLENALKTSDERQDDAPYRRGLTVNSVNEVSNDGTTRVISVDYTEIGNSSLNRVGEDFGVELPSIEGLQGTFVFTLTKSNDPSIELIQSVAAKER